RAVDDVGRLLAAARRYREAGEVLLGSLPVRPGQVGQLERGLKKRALSAALWLAKGGEAQVSVELFVALGERRRATEPLHRGRGAAVRGRSCAVRGGQVLPGRGRHRQSAGQSRPRPAR